MQILKLKRDERVKQGLLKIGTIAKLAGLLSSAVRFYTKLGLLKVEAATQGGYWLYDKEKTLKVLTEIKSLIDKGLRLDEIVALRKKQGRLEKIPQLNPKKVRNRKNEKGASPFLNFIKRGQ